MFLAFMLTSMAQMTARNHPEADDVNNSPRFDRIVAIDMSHPTDPGIQGVSVSIDGHHVVIDHHSTPSVCYVVSGQTTNGSLTIAGNQQYALCLKGVSIINPDSAAINLLSRKHVYVTLTKGTTNTLSDGSKMVCNAKGVLYCKGKMIVNGQGTLHVYSTSTATKGIKVKKDLFINEGTIEVKATGDDSEGIESKRKLTINGGTITAEAYDDAINAAEEMNINGGTVVAIGYNSDGLDSNGDMFIRGGKIVAFGGGGPESGIDVDEQHALYISGGSIFSIGGRLDARLASTSQGIITTIGSVKAYAPVTITQGSTTLTSFTMPAYSYNEGAIMTTAPSMDIDKQYTIQLSSGTQSLKASNQLMNYGL